MRGIILAVKMRITKEFESNIRVARLAGLATGKIRGPRKLQETQGRKEP